jgi:drug/metabolite transporter (DMT)-like permease
MKNLYPFLIVFIGAASYGLLATFVKIGYGLGFTVGEVTGSQMFIGAVLLWVVALTQYKKWERIAPATVMKLMGVGSLAGLTGIFYYSSLQTLPASIAIVLLFQFTWVGILLEWIFDKKRPSKQNLYAVILVMIGTLLSANLVSSELALFSWYGLFMGLCSAFTYAGFIYVSGKVSTEITPWLRSPIMVSGSFIIIFLIFPPTFFMSGVLMEGLLPIAIAIAIFGAVLPTICFTYGVPKIGVGIATIISSVELPVAVLMAWLILSEFVSTLQWIGVLLILVAIVFEKLTETFDTDFGR